MTPQEIRQRFLNAIAGPESAGRYDVRYTPQGGTTFTGFETHPRIYEPGPKGPSSAAGRYQITYQTYKGLGGGPFTPEAQDEMAWRLGVRDYKARTGRDLEADLREQGFTPQIMQALSPTWVGLADNPKKAAEWFNKPVTEGGQNQPSLLSPTPMASTAQPAKPAAPVYSQDLGTQFRLLGNAWAPDWVDKPTPLTEEQAAAQIREQNAAKQQLSQAGDAMKAFQALQAYGQQQQAIANQPISLLQPNIVRGQFRPIQPMRGLL